MHYKTIKFNIKVPLNIHKFHFCRALCAQSLIFRLCAQSAPNFCNFFYFCPPPPPSPNPKNGSTPLTLTVKIGRPRRMWGRIWRRLGWRGKGYKTYGWCVGVCPLRPSHKQSRPRYLCHYSWSTSICTDHATLPTLEMPICPPTSWIRRHRWRKEEKRSTPRCTSNWVVRSKYALATSRQCVHRSGSISWMCSAIHAVRLYVRIILLFKIKKKITNRYYCLNFVLNSAWYRSRFTYRNHEWWIKHETCKTVFFKISASSLKPEMRLQ